MEANHPVCSNKGWTNKRPETKHIQKSPDLDFAQNLLGKKFKQNISEMFFFMVIYFMAESLTKSPGQKRTNPSWNYVTDSHTWNWQATTCRVVKIKELIDENSRLKHVKVVKESIISWEWSWKKTIYHHGYLIFCKWATLTNVSRQSQWIV